MTTSQNKTLVEFFQEQDPVSTLILVALSLASIGVVAIILTWNIYRVKGIQMTIAAGDKTGESYIISEAIKEVVERESNIKITVVETGGTAANLKMLQNGTAQLATAQADVVTEAIENSGRDKTYFRNIAVLYKDIFQLVVKDPKIQRFVQLKGKRIAVQASGGQYKSFLAVAQHYGLKPSDFKITGLDRENQPIKGYDDEAADRDFAKNRADAVFRVRTLGNRSISNLVNKDQGILLAIPQADAMKIKNPALESAIIPEGAYQGAPPVPGTNLPTVGVARLLLTTEQVDPTQIQELAQIIYDNRQEIINAIAPKYAEVKPLIASISRPNDTESADVSLHPGALAFYERDKPSFIQSNADPLAFGLTVSLLIFQWIRRLKLWIDRRRKNEADEYLKSAINLMKDEEYQPEQRAEILDETFHKAAEALVFERISQESFRTFNDAYKTTKEAIERDRKIAQAAVEQKQRENSAQYIKMVVKLLQYRQNESQELLQQNLNQILEKIVSDLVEEKISQESFRTFIDAYKATRYTIESKDRA
jgi:TRAP transporter TAXI family solute receptor